MYQKQNGCHPCGGCIPNKARPSRPASGKPAGLAAYGGLYNSGTQLVFFTAADVPVQVKLNTPMPLKNVTAVNNSLTVQTAGDYEINYNILLNTSQASTAAAAVRRNGDILTQTRGSQTLAEDDTANLSFDGRLSASVIVPLSSGDVLDLVLLIVRTLPDNLDAIVNNNANATLSIKKLDS
ncbi:BclA C-terminal domain-containing protein [Eisenbergiella tayi]|uniref:BclA C-terminal domain-containing protein n=1 Tax=Eisenbergiella tayi TaxID=1432052 RepID=UPI00114CD3A2|nr:hypothetical protein [Eisenbergiella tayi]